ncbi:N-acetylneuraminate synthase family protein [Treponema sp.]|uniref:N-acetylneuraminate synthase family protein n=1 Tax=Treponema sp. TaxID=166 RepID=UPI00388DD3FB
MKIIAEIGTSHGGDLIKAKELIDLSIESGADFVKFQWVYASEILHPKTGFVNLPTGKIPLYDRFKELEVKPDFFAECLDYTHKKGAEFLCSPFGLRSLEELISIKPDAIKIASPELNHIPLLKKLAEYRRTNDIPVIVSSGVSKLSDIEEALSILGRKNLTLLHCITSYPAPEEEYNLRLIPNLSAIFGVPCGVSDHSLDPILVPSITAAVGGTVIEKHITISKETDGLDDPVALTGEQFSVMSHCVHQCDAAFRQYGEKAAAYILNQLKDEYGERIEKILGTGVKELAEAEKANYGRTNRSLHFMRKMKKGEIISKNDIGVLRTEKELSVGLHPGFLDKVIGSKVNRDIQDGEGVQLDFLSFQL